MRSPAGSQAGTLQASLTAGILIGIVEVVIATSFATLIFGGDLVAHLPRAIGLALFAGAALLAVLALLGSLPGAMGSAQDVPAAILAVMAATVAARLPAEAPETFLTVVLVIALSSILLGAFLVLLGSLRLGNLVRFVPYPVVGGFLGGTGVLLTRGAFGVFTGAEISLGSMHALFNAGSVLRWLPGLLMALLLVVLMRRGAHYLVVPGVFLAAVAIFHLAVVASGSHAAQAEAGGWLLGPLPSGALWAPWTPDAVLQADWSLVSGQLPELGTLVVVSALGLLLNATGIELAARSDVDLDRELQAVGVANIAAGLGGGVPGYHAVSLSVLALQMRARSRLVGLVAAAVCAVGFLAGAAALALVPRAAIGGLLLFIGIDLIVTWLYDTWSRLPRVEYVLLVIIVAVIAAWGFATGVLTGLVAAVALFLVSYSRIDVVKDALTGGTYQSNVDRSAAEREHLEQLGSHLQIVKLHGFLFFGTANALFERVRDRVADSALPAVRYLVLDLRRVTGLDSSAAVTFTKISRLADEHGFTVVLTALDEGLRQKLEQAGMSQDQQPALRTFGDIDHGVQWCEDRLLQERGVGHGEIGDSSATGLDGIVGDLDLAPLEAYLERVDVPEGSVLMRQGDAAEDLFFLAAGRLTASFRPEVGDGVVRLRTVGAGSVVGELALYLGRTRSATVTADVDCTVLRLSQQRLRELERDEPEVAARLHRWLAALMARRVVDNVRTIAALLD